MYDIKNFDDPENDTTRYRTGCLNRKIHKPKTNSWKLIFGNVSWLFVEDFSREGRYSMMSGCKRVEREEKKGNDAAETRNGQTEDVGFGCTEKIK